VGRALVEADVRVLEVPLTGPGSLPAMRALVEVAREHEERAGERILVGAGTVLAVEQVEAVVEAGGGLIVSPNIAPEVVRATRAAGLVSMPGVATPTEAFLALSAGADVLKLFPGEAIGPAVLRAWRPIFPGARLFPVGGVRPDHFGDWLAAGADGFGLGTALYRAGDRGATVRVRAEAVLRAWRAAIAGTGRA
jgi:2-dehydro-3-deoxyphosphogalactonate aldolase